MLAMLGIRALRKMTKVIMPIVSSLKDQTLTLDPEQVKFSNLRIRRPPATPTGRA
ncbi:hypothetical protein [Bradyrhizobium sp. JR3.5]